MELPELIDRFMSIDKNVFFDNPYIRDRKTSPDDIAAAMKRLDETSEPDDLKLLFCLDYSREVQGMSENFGAKITDREAADRAERFWSEHYGKTNQE